MRAKLVDPEFRKWLTLVAVAFGLFMIMLDNTVVNVSLPSIRRDLGISISQLEWIVNAYALTFGVLLLSGGKLADLFGRRRIFMAGLVIFTASSFACGLANGGGLLIGARTVQGIGAALMNPATLSIITATFPPRQRGTAIGIWAGISAMALAIGPLVGGFITEHFNWSWIFYINVPIGIAGLFAARLFIDESRDTSREQRLDPLGLVTSAIALFALTYGLIDANRYGWGSGRIVGLFVVAAVFFFAFLMFERNQRLPMLDLSLFKNVTFAGANVVMLLVGLAMFGVFFFVSLFVQNVMHYSPTQAGASFLPMTGLIILVAPIAGRFSDKIGSRWLVGVGQCLLAVSLFFFSRLTAGADFWNLLPAMLVGGFGMSMSMSPLTSAAMGSVPVDKAGVGSAVINSMRQIGGSIGIALMGAIIASQGVATAAAPFTIHGFRLGLEVSSAIAIAGAIVALTTLHATDPRRATAAQAEPAAG
jgi:EmrB/QacA subfamily drug resistance transporter